MRLVHNSIRLVSLIAVLAVLFSIATMSAALADSDTAVAEVVDTTDPPASFEEAEGSEPAESTEGAEAEPEASTENAEAEPEETEPQEQSEDPAEELPGEGAAVGLTENFFDGDTDPFLLSKLQSAMDTAGKGYDFPTDEEGNRYYIAPGRSTRTTGWLLLEGKWYYFDSYGNLVTGWFKMPSGYTYYFEASGIVHRGWAQRDGEWYYCRPSDATLQTGWLLFDGCWYYFNLSTGKMTVGWIKTSGGYSYYFDESGVVHRGWLTDNGNTYYCRPGDATLQTGWLLYDGEWYYFNVSTGRMCTGWTYASSGYWYYFNEDGTVHRGWATSHGNTYYMRPEDGTEQTGWRVIDGEWFFFGSDGRMRTGWVMSGGQRYYFYREDDGLGGVTGANASDITVDGCYVNQLGYTTDTWTVSDTMLRLADDQLSQTKYLIMVDRTNCCFGVFEGSQHNWTRIRYEYCSPGALSTPTPTGTYSIMAQGKYFDSYGARCWYYSYFRAGGYCLHSVLCDAYGNITDGRLGAHLSHGCVRMAVDTAYWIYMNCPIGTAVVVY